MLLPSVGLVDLVKSRAR